MSYEMCATGIQKVLSRKQIYLFYKKSVDESVFIGYNVFNVHR